MLGVKGTSLTRRKTAKDLVPCNISTVLFYQSKKTLRSHKHPKEIKMRLLAEVA